MNPFSYGTIVTGENFYDRKDDCSRIVTTLSQGNNLVLFAPRRYGKTSLVFKAIEQLEEDGFTCIYFDFSPVYSLESFVNLYIHAIEKKQSNIQKLVQTISKFIKNIRPKMVFDTSGNPEFGIEFSENIVSIETLSDVLDLPEKLAQSNKKTIVIFDEFQEITKFHKFEFENLLRSKTQQQQFVNYIFLGSKTHMLQDMFSNKSRAFYNSAFHMQLGTLPHEDTILFLQQKFAQAGMLLDTETAQFIISQSGDIPYYIQLLAAEIWQFMITSHTVVTNEIVTICTNQVVALKHDYYFELFDKQSVMQKQLLKALVYTNENIFSADFTKKFRLHAVSTTQKAVLVLMDNGIIDKSDNMYFISDPFFKRFLIHYAS